MAINGLNLFTNNFRLGGLATGMDTDNMVSSLMSIERVPLDRVYQRRQLTEWKRDDYRSITNLLRELKDEYFNNLKMSTNMLSQASYKKYTSTTTNKDVVTVSGNAGSSNTTHTISVVKLATADKADSAGEVNTPLEGTAIGDYQLEGKRLRLTLDGVTREITLDNYSFSSDDLPKSDIVTKTGTGLQALLDSAFGAGKIVASYNDATGTLSFGTAGGASKLTFSGASSNDALSDIGFSAGASNRLDINKTLDALKDGFAQKLTFNEGGKLKFTINGKAFEFDKSTTLAKMMNVISSDTDAKVNMQYSEITGRFVLTAKQLGDGDNIMIEESSQEGNFFGPNGASGILAGSAATEQGEDAEVIIDGETVVRSGNTFTISGVTYNLLKAHTNPSTESETVSLSIDVDGIFENIKKFIESYNKLISGINDKLSESNDRKYPPLTEVQKDAMKEDEIKKWEEAAKKGLLRNDPILQDIAISLRKALTDSIEGSSITLYGIGIRSISYTERGKLTIDEYKLKEAIRENPEAVIDLFSKQSDISSSIDLTQEQRTERYKNQGLAYRLFDIVEDNVRTIRDKDGKKGILLEKAGLVGDASEFSNLLYKEIDSLNIRMNELTERLISKENAYYRKFAAMEKMISAMNSQSSWLSAQLNKGI